MNIIKSRIVVVGVGESGLGVAIMEEGKGSG